MARPDVLRPHPGATLDETFQGLTPRVHKLLRLSFSELAWVPDVLKSTVLDDAVTASMNSTFDSASFAERLGVTVDKARLIANAASFLSAVVTAFEENSSHIAQKMLECEMVNEDDISTVKSWLDFLREHTTKFESDIESNSVAHRILPSLDSFSVAVDLRLADQESVSRGVVAVPVAVACLDTDAEGQVVWFQMSKAQLLHLKKQLNDALAQFENAEKILAIAKREL